ncbi:FadR/GntR family transcriptional regulator [Alkalicoccus chagannorensis]|uniref:FadR/GntR family transcriptional regulator n=1 Tax=Alkalicoccus chagannorensis TaxID=427072 RepID=UPI0003FE21A9|nr:FadR/GntR family transcriptional regulator [Alkalicoccus chagannorensis]
MSFKQVQSKKIAEIVREQIEEMIRSGELQPGDKLASVVQLAEQLRVSRSAVREALSALRAVGVVTIKQGEGTYINNMDMHELLDSLRADRLLSRKEMLELFELRRMLEGGTAEYAAMRRSDKDLAAMREALSQMRHAESGDDVGEAADVAFHLAVATASGNHTVLRVMEQLAETLRSSMYEARRIWLYTEKRTMQKLVDEHEAVYEAIAAQDGTASRRAMLTHLENVEAVLLRGLDQEKNT